MDMRKSKRKWRGLSVLMAAALSVGALLGTFTAYGAQAEVHPDLTRKGSVSVTMIDKTTNKPVGGGEMTLYQVAKTVREDWNDSFAYTEAFADCPLTLENPESEKLAGELAAFAGDKGIAGEKKAIGSDGIARYEELETGLYLLVQSKAAAGYEVVTPFLAAVPILINGELNYDVDATPKTSGAAPGAVKPTRPAGSSDESDERDDDSLDDTRRPPNPTQTAVITDETEHYDPETFPVSPTEEFPIPDEPVPANVLPKTGQLWWPVPVLAAAGFALFLFGWKERRRQG